MFKNAKYKNLGKILYINIYSLGFYKDLIKENGFTLKKGKKYAISDRELSQVQMT